MSIRSLHRSMASSTAGSSLDPPLESIAFIVGFTLIFFVLIKVGLIASLLMIVAGLNLVVIYLLYRVLVAVEAISDES